MLQHTFGIESCLLVVLQGTVIISVVSILNCGDLGSERITSAKTKPRYHYSIKELSHGIFS